MPVNASVTSQGVTAGDGPDAHGVIQVSANDANNTVMDTTREPIEWYPPYSDIAAAPGTRWPAGNHHATSQVARQAGKKRAHD